MFDDRSEHYNLPLPNLSNPLRADVERLRTTISMLDTLLKNLDAAANAAMHYVGDWDASTNTPALPAAAAANNGNYYVVSASGSTTVDGLNKWVTGDWIVSNGVKWMRIPNSGDASAIQSGEFALARIPNLPMSMITGLLDTLNAQIPISQVANLQSLLDAKQAALGYTPVNQAAPLFTATATIQNTAPQITFSDTDWGVRHVHCNSGLIGFLTNAGGWACYSQNDGAFVASGNVAAYSDIKHKTDISTIDDPVDLVEQLRGVRYTDKRTGQRRVGVIAQEVQEILPEVVGEGVDGLHVDYGNIVGPLIEAVKALSARVKELEGR